MLGLFQCHTALARECWFALTPVQTNSAGAAPQSVALGDFNGDGRPDLVVANQFSANVSVLLGNGNGTFQPAVHYAAGQGPSAVAVGDFNADNRADLAVANSSANTVSVLLGNGNGTFQAAVNYFAGTVPIAVTVRDLNADSVPDLAVANRNASAVSVLLGDGSGGFEPAVSYSAGVGPQSVAAGDFNNDSRPDLAVANAALFDSPPSVSVLLGKQPNGTFENPADYDAGISPRAVVIEDFNGDGKRDLAVANYGQIAGPTTTNSSIPVFLGQGDGTFQNAVHYSAGAGPIALAAADFDTNAILDLVVANERSGTLSVLFGQANGTFGPPYDFRAGTSPRSVAVGDFNADGKPDVAVVNDSGVLILLNDCLVGADVALTITDAPDPILFGNQLTYSIQLTNRGPDPATNVTLADILPATVTYVSATTTLGVCTNNNGTIQCAFGLMDPGAQATVTLVVTPNVATTLGHTATVAYATADWNPANNIATATTLVQPLIRLTATDPNAAEAGFDPGTYTVSRVGGTLGPRTVSYTLSGTAANGADYVALSGSVTIPNGAASNNITLQPLDDPLVELTETAILNLTTNPAYVVDPAAATATVSIFDTDVPAITLNDVTLTEGHAGTTTANFNVRLSTPSHQTVTVIYATADNTALAGADYVASNGLLTFAPGITNQTVSVPILGDGLHEANETYFVNLANPTNATLADSQGAGTILDDDPLPTLTLNDVTVAEATGGTTVANFTVRLSAVYPESVTVDYATANGTALSGADYVATNGSLTFAPGNTNQTVAVTVQGDPLDEANETFFVNLINPTNATLADSQGVGMIQDDDPLPALTIENVTVVERTGGTTQAVFRVLLSIVSGRSVTVNFTTVNGTATAGNDYVATNGVVNFAPGTTNQTITVEILGDLLNEADETFLVNLSQPTNASLTVGQGVGTVNNDDPLPALAIVGVTVTESTGGMTNALFSVGLSAVSGQSVTVRYSTADGTAMTGSDFVATNGLVAFAPGNTNQTIAVRVLGDPLDEVDESFFVNLTNPTNAFIADGQAVGTINDDDSPPALSINDVSVTEGNAGTVQATFSVSLSAPSGLPITVNFATGDDTAIADSDYLATNGLVNFAPGSTNQTFSVAVIGDTDVEVNEAFFGELSNPENATLARSQGVGSIINDDGVPGLSITDSFVVEAHTGSTQAVFTVELSAPFDQPVTVQFATVNGTALAGADYVATNGILSFEPGITNQAFAVNVLGDMLSEADETFHVNLSNPTNAFIADGQGLGTSLDDDPLPSVSINDVTLLEGNVGTTQAVFRVALSAVSGQTVSVHYATADGTANAGNAGQATADYIATNGVVNFAPGSTQQTIAVVLLGDVVHETNETFFVNLSNPTNTTILDSQGRGTINNNDPLPSFTISDVTVNEGNAGTTQAVFTVSLSNPSDRTLTVNFTTANGSATAGSDYLATNGIVTLAPGETNRTIAVVVFADLLNEADDTFFVNLSNSTNAVIGDNQGVGAISNDDPLPELTISDATLTEGNSGTTLAMFVLSLSAPSGRPLTVTFATANDTASAGNAGQPLADYVATNGILTIAPGATNRTIAVAVLGDLLNEADETLLFNLSNPTNVILGDNQAVGTISNDDPLPGLSINDVTLAEGTVGTTNAVFSVTLSAASGRPVTVSYTTADGTATLADYVATNGLLSFPPGTVTRTFAIPINSDSLSELTETFLVNLSAAVNATINDGQAVATIINSRPEASIGNVTLSEGNTGTTNAVFTVRLSSAYDQLVTMNYATANNTALAGSDYLSTNGVLSFGPGMTNQAITVTVLGDLLNEVNESFLVNLASATNAVIAAGQGVGTIINDDPLPSLAIQDAAVFEGDSGTTTALFRVALSAASGRTVTVNYGTANDVANGSDLTHSSGQLTFAPGQTNQFISVTIKGDTSVETNETFLATLSNPVNAALARSQAFGTILNDDGVPALSINDVSVVEGHSGLTQAVFTVQLAAAFSQLVTVQFATSNATALAGADYVATNGTLSFPPGTTTRTIAVAVLGESLSEGNESFLVYLSGAVNALISDASGLGAIQDDDPFNFLLSTNSLAVAEGGAGSFGVRLLSAPASNVTVTVARAGGVTNLAVAAGAALTFTPSNWNVFQPVLISAGGDADALNDTAWFAVSRAGSSQLVTVTALDDGLKDGWIVALELVGGDVVLRFKTTANQLYRVQRTESLLPPAISWVAVGSPVPSTGGIVSVVDVGGAGRPSRFYRVVLLPLPSEPEGLRIVGLEFAGNDVVVRFATSPEVSYRLEQTDQPGVSPWSAVGNPVVGTGAVLPVTDVAGAGRPSRFYRVVQLAP